MGEKMGEKGRENPMTEKILLFKRSGQLNEATLASSLRWAQAFSMPPSIQNCLVSCNCLFIFEGEKKVCLTQKARKYTVWRGLKELSCPDALRACSFVN